jgi:hypothetical protein
MTKKLIEAMAANDPQKWYRIQHEGQVVTYKSHSKNALYARTSSGSVVEIPNGNVQWIQPGTPAGSDETPSEAAATPISDETPDSTDNDDTAQKSPQKPARDGFQPGEVHFKRMEAVIGQFASRDDALEFVELLRDVVDNVHPPANNATEAESDPEAMPV